MRAILILLALTLLGGCSSDEADDLESTELQYYQAAQSALRASNYQEAVRRLQLLESRFPFGRYAEQAQLEIIYAYYKSQQSESARAAADRFIRLHPQHPNVDYAYYLKGMASFEEDQNFMAQFLPLDPSTRDPGAAKDSFNDFAQLINRFPDSPYAPDAQKRMIYLRNLLARYEINVARYYIYRGAYVAAANRGRYVFENYQGAPSVPEALSIMVEAYSLLNQKDLADDALAVLNANYPDYRGLNRSGELKDSESVKSNERSWLNIITFGLLG
ncbi:MAG: outer membrane protein assembly factor BamD [Pseudomonadales bacterium]|nr:outer membrane protein assembly factor BamD [Pseudomonadales bacterium]